MKKFIYVTLFVIITGLASSCTEEEIRPQGGTGGTDTGQKY
ncbi:MAG: hypothetical protein RIB47_09805 [Cyclobacteriaceae bacterium]